MEASTSTKQLKRRGLDLEDVDYQVKCSRVETAGPLGDEEGQSQVARTVEPGPEVSSRMQEDSRSPTAADAASSRIASAAPAAPSLACAQDTAAGALALLPPLPLPAQRATLVLDMDKTLIFKEWRLQPYDKRPQVVFQPDFHFNITYRGYPVQYHVKKRPFLDEFLHRAAELFEVVLFTASESIVTLPVVEQLDPQRRLFQHVLCRAACTERQGFYVKNLARLGRDLGRVVIIDDNPDSFMWQPDNAILVSEFSGWESHDRELLRLLPVLDLLAGAPDVRSVVAALRQRSRQAPAPPAGYHPVWLAPPAAAGGEAAGWGEEGGEETQVDAQEEESEDSVVYL